MSRYALILYAGILAVISVACVATVPSPAPQFPPVPHPGPRLLGSRATFVPAVLTANPTCSDADDFIRRIKVLKAGYDPNPPTGPYNPPDTQIPPAGAPPNNPYNLRQEIVDDLKAAYNNAPRLFKDQLCQLDGIYLNPTGCVLRPDGSADVNNCPSANLLFGSSWGFRSYRQNAGDNGLRYIAISANLWPPQSNAFVFSDFSNRQLQAIIAKKFAPWTNISVTSANPNTSWMTILAALAHELGHVRWADTVVALRAPPQKPAGGPPDYSYFQNNCPYPNGNFFSGWAVKDQKQLFPKNRWRDFSERDNDYGQPIDHSSPPYIYQFNTGSSDDKNFRFSTLLYAGNNPPWASFFGSLTPDEDFVETYNLGVLTDGSGLNPLTSLQVTVTYNSQSYQIDIPGTLSSRQKLQDKVACIP